MPTSLSIEEAQLLFPGAARTDLTCKAIWWLYTTFVVVVHRCWNILVLSPLLLTGPSPSAQVGNGHLLCTPKPNPSYDLLVHHVQKETLNVHAVFGSYAFPSL